MDELNGWKELKSISGKINELIERGEFTDELYFIESWISGQLNLIEKLKQNSKPLFYNKHIFKTIYLNSELITDFEFRIVKHTGFFSYLLATHKYQNTLPNFLEIVDSAYRAEFMVFLKANQLTDLNFLFETKIHPQLLTDFKCIFKIRVLFQKRQYRFAIKQIRPVNAKSDFAFWGVKDEKSLADLGMSLLLLDSEYKIRDLLGSETLISKIQTSNYLFEALNPEYAKRIYPFVNKALKGLFSSGEVRIEESVFNVCAFPVKDEDGFSNASILLTKENSN